MALFVSLLFVFMLPLFWVKYKGFLVLAVGNFNVHCRSFLGPFEGLSEVLEGILSIGSLAI